MTRDEFIRRWLEETTGLLLLAFHADHEAQRPMAEEGLARVGRFFLHQQKRARDLLSRMYDEMQPNKAMPPAQKNGAPVGPQPARKP